MFKILGTDQKEYGPVSAEVINQWIRENRANAATQVQPEGATDWKPLAEFPEFAAALQNAAATAATPSPFATAGTSTEPATPESLTRNDYFIQIGDCFERSWQLYKENFGLFLAVSVIFVILLSIPNTIGTFISLPFTPHGKGIAPGQLAAYIVPRLVGALIQLVIMGPFGGGIFSIFLKRARGQQAEVGSLFSYFSNGFGTLFLAYIVPYFLTLLACLPGIALVVFGVIQAVTAHHATVSSIVFISFGLVLAMLASIRLSYAWAFTIPLVVDKQLDFWEAMKVSWEMTGKHFGKVFLTLFLAVLVYTVGILFCCIGIFFTLPIGVGVGVYMYETMFNPQQPRTPTVQ